MSGILTIMRLRYSPGDTHYPPRARPLSSAKLNRGRASRMRRGTGPSSQTSEPNRTGSRKGIVSTVRTGSTGTLRQRQRDPKDRPFTRRALDPDSTALRLHQALCHGQAEACAARQSPLITDS
jgi:hypothetical protein